MSEIASVFQSVRIGVETTPGTAVACDKLLRSIGIAMKIEAEVETFTPVGSKYAALSVLGKEWSSGSLEGKPTYDELTYVFAGIVGNMVTTNPTTGVYEHVFVARNRAADVIKTFSVERGSDRYWWKSAYGLVTELGLEFSRSGIELSGAMMARRMALANASSRSSIQKISLSGGPTGGTFTLTFGSQTTGNIAYNATAAAVQTALEALSNIAAGDVYVTGGPGPSTPWLVHFINGLADAAQPAITGNAAGLTGGTSPNVVVTQTQTGGVLTELALAPVLPQHCDVYLVDAYADLATASPLDRDFVLSFSLGDRFAPVWPLRSSYDSWAAHVETAPKLEWKLKMSADDVGRGLLATMRAGATKFIRLKAQGDAISTGYPYLLQMDGAVKISAAPSGPEDSDGVDTLEWTFVGVPSADIDAAGSPLKITLRNGLAAL